MRILLYTGKGGSGKTTVAAATAVRCADTNRRTLIIGSDTSQSLADCLNVALSDEPQEVADNLWAEEIDPLVRLERWWPQIEPLLGESFSRGISGTALEELTLGPGLADVIRLLAIKEQCDANAYDVIVVDLGSSLTALQLLSYPEGASWWIDRLIGPTNGDAPHPLVSHVDTLAERLAQLRARLGDGAECSIRIVTTPELLAVRETTRSLTFTNLYGYNVDAIVLNREKRVARNLADTFSGWPILSLSQYDRDVVGYKLLSEMGLALFPPPTDPAAVLVSGQAQRLTRGPNGYVLSLKLPFIREDDIDLLQHNGQLILQVGRMRRVLQLPEPVDRLAAADALLEEGTLEVHFR